MGLGEGDLLMHFEYDLERLMQYYREGYNPWCRGFRRGSLYPSARGGIHGLPTRVQCVGVWRVRVAHL